MRWPDRRRGTEKGAAAVHDWTFSYWFLYGRNPAPPPPRWDGARSEDDEQEGAEADRPESDAEHPAN
jgi:hypothetical protein